MTVDVIVNTYNQPQYLSLVLCALERQSHRDFGLIVTDDGSGPETRKVIEAVRRAGHRPVTHLWQPNRGFRKCRALNRAIARAQSDYLVFLDGDTLPRGDWLLEHLRLARPRLYLAGRMLRFDRPLSNSLDPEDILSGRFAHRRFLLDQWRAGHIQQKPLYAFVPPSLGRFLFRRDGGAWTGSNGSLFREDALAVNGFDEQFTYGSEDTDFGRRLERSGVARRSVRYSALAFHLDHNRPYRTDEVLARNRALLDENLRLGRVRCTHGIDELATSVEPEAWVD